MLNEHLKSWERRHPELVKEIRNGLYVDDLMTGGVNAEEVGERMEDMALMPVSSRNMMSKYRWPLVVTAVFSVSMIVYHLLVQFNDRKINRKITNSLANHPLGKEILTTNTKCDHLHEIALEMLSNGDRVALPCETNNTRWTFHKRADLNYLITNFRRSIRYQPIFNHLPEYNNIKAKDIKATKYFVTFAHNCCNKSKAKAIEAARDPVGFVFVAAHDMSSLSEKFRYKHSAILKQYFRRVCLLILHSREVAWEGGGG